VKLVDVPEMGYLSTTKTKTPERGEIWICGANVFQGYYKDLEETSNTFYVDKQNRRWFKTGDIGEWQEDGSLKLIDRKKNLFKLSQGEYIRPEYIEGIYKCALPKIANIFVHGNSQENYLVAIIHPDFNALRQFCSTNGIIISEERGKEHKHLSDHRVKSWLLVSMNQVAKQAKLNTFEMVKKIHLTFEDFTVNNDLLTPTFKLKRNNAAIHFKQEIEEMYAGKEIILPSKM